MGNVNTKLQESDADAFADRHHYRQCNAITCAPGQHKLDNQGTLGVTSSMNLLRVRFPGGKLGPGIGSSNAWRSRPCCATQAFKVSPEEDESVKAYLRCAPAASLAMRRPRATGIDVGELRNSFECRQQCRTQWAGLGFRILQFRYSLEATSTERGRRDWRCLCSFWYRLNLLDCSGRRLRPGGWHGLRCIRIGLFDTIRMP